MRRQCLPADGGNEAKAKQVVGVGNLAGFSHHWWNSYLRVPLIPLPTLLQQGGPGVRADLSLPQVITSGIAAIALSLYLPSIPLVCHTFGMGLGVERAWPAWRVLA